MEENTKSDEIDNKWYFVIVQDPASCHEQFVGFADSKSDEQFIPVFKTKVEAQTCFTLMPKDLFNGKFDVQAVIEDDLIATAKENGHKLYLLDGKGTILETLETGENS